MKKLFTLFWTVIILFLLVACDPSPTISTSSNQINNPIIPVTTKTTTQNVLNKIDVTKNNFESYFTVSTSSPSNNSFYNIDHNTNTPYFYSISVSKRSAYSIDSSVSVSIKITLEITYRRSDNTRLNKSVLGTANLSVNSRDNSDSETVLFYPRLGSSESIVSINVTYVISSASGKVY